MKTSRLSYFMSFFGGSSSQPLDAGETVTVGRREFEVLAVDEANDQFSWQWIS